MKLDKNKSILIVGLGLIGGSYAKALSKKGFTINAITKEQSSVDFALKNGYIEYGTTEVEEELVKKSSIIIFALYPTAFVEWIEKYQSYFSPKTIITDVTGVKGAIVFKIQAMLRRDVEFIPAHPMAGREKSGVENADETVFYDANYIVTPTIKNTFDAIELCADIGREIGFSRISVLSAEDHDNIIGFVSQLTHCIAIALMTCDVADGLENYTGDSFRDLTRIARLNDEMWSELFLLNKDTLKSQIKMFESELDKIYEALDSGDRPALREMMKYSTKRRDLFDKKKPEEI